jgi:hypothetical protein
MSSIFNTLKIRTGIIILYSIAIIASVVPAFVGDISNSIRFVYYLLVPGYVITLYLGEDYAVVEHVLLSFAWSLVVVMFIYSFNQISAFALPFALIIPIVSIVLIIVDYYRRRIRFI